MAQLNKPTFAVSVTPSVTVGEVDNEMASHTVMHESVRRTLSGSGTYTGDDITVGGGWNEGVNTAVTSSGGSVPALSATTGVVFIKHTGLLFGTTTACAAADTVQITHNSNIMSELKAGEAIILVRPGATASVALASGSAAVGVEVCVIDS
jgi:hypothetical protein